MTTCSASSCARAATSGWRVGPELRRLVEFRQHNLTTDRATRAPPGPDPVPQRSDLLRPPRHARGDRRDPLGAGSRRMAAAGPQRDALAALRRLRAGSPRRRVPLPAATAGARPWCAGPRRCDARLRSRRRRAPDPLEEIRDALSAGAYAAAADLAAAHLEAIRCRRSCTTCTVSPWSRSGTTPQALVALRRAAYLDPASGFAQFLLAVVLGRLGHGAEAARAYGAAAQALSRRGPDERAHELGGRRVDDLAQMCRQLAGGSSAGSLSGRCEVTAEVTAVRVLAFHSGSERYLVHLDAVRAVVRLRGPAAAARLRGSSGGSARRAGDFGRDLRHPRARASRRTGSTTRVATCSSWQPAGRITPSGWPATAWRACWNCRRTHELAATSRPAASAGLRRGTAACRRDDACRWSTSSGLQRPPPWQPSSAVERSDVTLENARLGEPGQSLSHRTGAGLTDAVDGLQIVDARRQQLLQAAEMVDQTVDDQPRQPRAPSPAAGNRAGFTGVSSTSAPPG